MTFMLATWPDIYPGLRHIVSKSQYHRVNALMRSRAPKITHPRRVGSSYLLSGLVKCKPCRRAFSGQEAQSGRYAYYVCQSLMKRGKDACDSPKINARSFEEMVVERICSNILTSGNISALVKVVEEQMDAVAQEQRKRIQTIENELVDVKRRLDRVWHYIETDDNVDTAKASARMREHLERQERLEDAEADARAALSQRMAVLDDVGTLVAYAKNMPRFLNESAITEGRAFVETFVKEIVVRPGSALVRYTIPMPKDSPIPCLNAEEMALESSVLSTGTKTSHNRDESQRTARSCLGANGSRVALRSIVHLIRRPALANIYRAVSPLRYGSPNSFALHLH